MQAQDITFYTPNTVRVIKESGTQNAKAGKKSLVVIANPEKVSVKQSKSGSATIYKSSALTVTVQDGKVSFADNKGNLLTSEGNWGFNPIANGPDKGSFKVKQSWNIEADEGIYGVGLLQNGKMSQRGR